MRGYTRHIKRKTGLQFIARLYNTNLVFHLHSDRYLEREAGSKKTSAEDPTRAIVNFELNDAVVIDVGANVGTMSLFSASCGAKKVYSFEPGPFIADLRSNIKLNNLENVIMPIQLGVSDKKGWLFWAEDLNNPGNAHLLNDFDELDMSKISTNFGDPSLLRRVEVTTLDHYFSDYMHIQKLDLLKIDVEGLELKVITGGMAIISKYMPYVIVETHRVASDMMRYDCISPIFSFFYSLNYESFALNDTGKLEKFIYPNFKMDTFFVPPSRTIDNL